MLVKEIKNYYKIAREIYYGFTVTQSQHFDIADGKKVRAALHVIVSRNPKEQKWFKSRIEGNKLKIWRKA